MSASSAPRSVAEYAVRLATLHRELKALEDEFLCSVRGIPGQPHGRIGKHFAQSVEGHIIAMLLRHPEREFAVHELTTLLGGLSDATVRAALTRLRQEGRYIRKTGRGRYRSKGTHPIPSMEAPAM